MKGLIIKDLLCLKSQMKHLIVIIFGFLILAMMNNDYSLMAFILPFYLVMIIISTFSYDEFNHFNSYCNSFPLPRKKIVMAKYVLTLGALVLSVLVGIILCFIIHALDGGQSFEELLSMVIGGVFGIGVVINILIPFFYKYGVQKGRIMLFAVVLGISLIGGLLIKMLEKFSVNIGVIVSKLNSLNFLTIVALLILFIVIITFVSYKISCRVYDCKEF